MAAAPCRAATFRALAAALLAALALASLAAPLGLGAAPAESAAPARVRPAGDAPAAGAPPKAAPRGAPPPPPPGDAPVPLRALELRGAPAPMPALGFGTCCRKASRGPALQAALLAYLGAGGRLVDTAEGYQNHKDVGAALARSGVPRDELWVTSKLCTSAQWCGNLEVNTAEDAEKAVDRSLRELGLAYLDLMLIHHPRHSQKGPGGPLERLDVWRGLVRAKNAGKVRNIGVSNFDRAQLQSLEDSGLEAPAVNQIQFHPWVPQSSKELVQWCQARGIAVTAFQSLGGSGCRAPTGHGCASEVLSQLARRKGATEAQVLLRWAVEQGVAVIPGSASERHIRENLQLSHFALGAAERALLEAAPRPAGFDVRANGL